MFSNEHDIKSLHGKDYMFVRTIRTILNISCEFIFCNVTSVGQIKTQKHLCFVILVVKM